MRLNKEAVVEKVFFITMGIYFFLSAMTVTMVDSIEIVDKVATLTRYICYLVFVVVIIANVVTSKTGNYFKRFVVDFFQYARSHVILILALLTTMLIFIRTRERLPLILVVIIWACSFYDFKKIAKTYLYASALLMMLAWMLSITGKIANIWVWREGKLRYSIGYVYPLETMSHFLFMILAYIYIVGKKFKAKDFLVINMISILLYYITEARASFALIFLSSLAAFLYAKINMEKLLKVIFPWIGYLLLAVCVLFSLGGGIAYSESSSLLVKIDSVISHRFEMMRNAFTNYGFSLFCKKIEWVGYGGLNDAIVETAGRYNFVDCAYAKMLLDYGIIFSILVLIGYAVIYYTASKAQDYALIIAISVVLVISVMEPRLVSIEMNPFVVLLGSFFLYSRGNKKKLADAGGLG